MEQTIVILTKSDIRPGPGKGLVSPGAGEIKTGIFKWLHPWGSQNAMVNSQSLGRHAVV